MKTSTFWAGSLGVAWLAACLACAQGQGGAGQKQEGPGQAEASAALQEGSGKKANRLIHEKSPYLLQHAYNPVDWHPWGEDAFAQARRQDKPIFLSIGYSTCHWCHVMERESFSDPDIAGLLNRHFVSIKVDREERPDVDQVYMSYVQAATGGGGWPMSVFLTPELKPFFGGTYFPPEAFKRLAGKVAEAWGGQDRERILASAGKAVEFLKDMGDGMGEAGLELDQELLDRAYRHYVSVFDPRKGGFGPTPKFPRPVNFNFLFRYHHRTGDERALEMALHTLREMAKGGIRDHLGGGFHRYSTDERWFLPHFEKMLYDQAQLAIAYLEGYQLSGDPALAETARGIFRYVLRDMRGPGGGFYSAEDADSPVPDHPEEEAEGAFYVWSRAEIEEVLGHEDASVFSFFYGVQENGNVDKDPFSEFKGKNVLHAAQRLDEVAKKFGRTEAEVLKILQGGRENLFQARSARPRPHLDDKVLTSWNGLMISALAKGYQALGEESYLRAAQQAAAFVAQSLYDDASKTLKRRYRDGDAAVDGMIDDYAFFTQGLLDLYEASLEGKWLMLAMDLTEVQNRLFRDAQEGGFFTAAGQDPSLLIRIKDHYDGAEPSANSVAALNLLRLSQMANSPQWRSIAESTIRAFASRLKQVPQAMPQMMVAVDFQAGKAKQILIAGDRDAPGTQAILREVHRRFIPNRIVVLADGQAAHRRMAKGLEILDSLRQVDSKPTAYICEDYVCKLPTNEVETVARLLDGQAEPQP